MAGQKVVSQATGCIFDDSGYVDIAQHATLMCMGQQVSIDAVEEMARYLLEHLSNELFQRCPAFIDAHVDIERVRLEPHGDREVQLQHSSIHGGWSQGFAGCVVIPRRPEAVRDFQMTQCRHAD
jgi:hypothetical protein